MGDSTSYYCCQRLPTYLIRSSLTTHPSTPDGAVGRSPPSAARPQVQGRSPSGRLAGCRSRQRTHGGRCQVEAGSRGGELPEALVIANAPCTSTSPGQRGTNSERWTRHGARDVSDGQSGKRSRDRGRTLPEPRSRLPCAVTGGLTRTSQPYEDTEQLHRPPAGHDRSWSGNGHANIH